MLLNYEDDDYSEGYGQIKEAFRALTKDILQPYITYQGFRLLNVVPDDLRFNLYVFDIRPQKHFTVSQPFKLEFKISGVIPDGINGYALVLTNELISMSSDGQPHFDQIQV